MAGLFGRIFKQWFEQALVDKIASSKAMQSAASAAVKASQEAQRLSEEAAKDPTKVKEGFFSLLDALRAEASKDFQKMNIIGGGGGDRVVDTTQASPPSAPLRSQPMDSYSALSVKQLKERLVERGVPLQGLLEKEELVQALRAAEKLK